MVHAKLQLFCWGRFLYFWIRQNRPGFIRQEIADAETSAGPLRVRRRRPSAGGPGGRTCAKQVDPTAEVRNIDVLEFTNAAFRRVYGKAYLDLVNKAPHVLGYFYDLMDRPPSSQRNADRLRLALEKLNMTAFLRFLKSEPWDIVVNTHFLPAELIASLRKGEKLTTPHFTVTTDYETHRLWVNQPCDHYFSATGEGAAYLAPLGRA